MRTHIERLANWIVELRPEHIPPRLFDIARRQLRSVLASVYPGANSDAGRACRNAALHLRTQGRATALPGGESVAPYAAVLCNAALSMVHDFDDYLFLGHTGHSAVLASLAVAEQEDACMLDMLVAQIAANEVAGRLGAMVAVGPQNGQLWAHVHLAGAVAAGARLRGLDAERTADALGIAFYQPPFTLFAGFMASDAKALTAAQPTAAGLYAVDLAADGLSGARHLLEHPRGFAAHFAYVPVPEMLRGLGDSWVTDSLSCKIYPGCAYIDGPVDAAYRALGEKGRLRAQDIQAIEISATALTAGMEALAEDAAPASSLSPITINFSARRSVAIALLAGSLSPRELSSAWLGDTDNAAAVRRVADCTRVEGNTRATVSMLEGIGRALPLGGLVRAIGVGRLWGARHRLMDAYAGARHSGGDDGGRRPPTPSIAGLGAIGRFVRSAAGSREAFDMKSADFSRLEFRFAAEVRIRTTNGRWLEGSCNIPRGAAGDATASSEHVVGAKLATELAAAGGASDAIEAVLEAPPSDTPARALGRAAVIA